MSLITLPDIEDTGLIIRISEYIDKGNWSFVIYRPGEKWKRIRSMQGYVSSESALSSAKAFIVGYTKKLV